jgi:hypothetical protein
MQKEKPMTQAIIKTLREQIAHFLPDAFMTALNNYQDVMTHPLDQEDGDKKLTFFKKSAEREDAARKNMAHIQLLLKLTVFMNLPDPAIADNSQIVLSALVQEAEEEVRRHRADFAS